MKDRRQTHIDRLNNESLEKARLEYEEQCRRLPDMQDAKVLAKLSYDIVQCIKSITDWHKIEDCLLPDKTTLIHFLECKWERSYPYYEINNGIRCQKWEHVSFNREGNIKELHITEHIHEWLTLLGLIAKSINSSLVSDFAHCLSVFGSWPCESGGLEHDIAVDVVERLFSC